MLLPNELFFQQVEQTLAAGQRVQIRMKGHSMRPLLREGRDIVVLGPCDGRKLQPGEIVLFRCKGRHILHRIRERSGERYTLAGDGNYRICEFCAAGDIAGRAVRIIRPSGRVIDCHSVRWRIQSRLWLSLPEGFRRQLLRVLWHLRILR